MKINEKEPFNLKHFILESPLYSEFLLEDIYIKDILDLIAYNEGSNLFNLEIIDSFCPKCEKEIPFISIPSKDRIFGEMELEYMSSETESEFRHKLIELLSEKGTFVREFYCPTHKNDPSYNMTFIFKIDREKVVKIGQNPSIAESLKSKLKKYNKVVTKSKLREFNTAVGLAAHGVGIGSFVYLRRIFEELVNNSYQKLKKENGWQEEQYSRSRMDGKIELLKSDLPIFLVQNKNLYGILSKGIHELDEDECLDYFPTVKLGIELILDEKLEELNRNKKINSAKNAIARISGKLK